MTATRVEVPMNRGQLGRALGLSHRTLAELLAAGVLAPVQAGKGRRAAVFDALVAIPAALAHERARRPGATARDRRDIAQAQLTEQLLSQRGGELLEKADVERVWRQHIADAKTLLEALPRAEATRCVAAARTGGAAAVSQLLEDAIRRALTALAGGQEA